MLECCPPAPWSTGPGEQPDSGSWTQGRPGRRPDHPGAQRPKDKGHRGCLLTKHAMGGFWAAPRGPPGRGVCDARSKWLLEPWTLGFLTCLAAHLALTLD